MAFSKQISWILRSFDPKCLMTRQTSEKVAYKLGFHYLLEYFPPSTFAGIISILTENIKKFL